MIYEIIKDKHNYLCAICTFLSIRKLDNLSKCIVSYETI